MLRPAYPIETERLLLRPFEAGDLEALAAIHGRADVARYLYWEPRTADTLRAVIADKATCTTLERAGDKLCLAVTAHGSDGLVGDITLFWVSEEHAQGEVGFTFSPAVHGRGYATEAARELLRLGFEDLGMHRICGRLDGRNRASARVLEKLGMRREAWLVENEWVKGEWTDEMIYALLAHEWRERAATRQDA